MNRVKFYAAMFAVIIGLLVTFGGTARSQTPTPTPDTPPPCVVTDPVVVNGFDSGLGSLMQAVYDACDGSTITFSPSMPPVVSLSSRMIEVWRSVTIAGPGAEKMTIRKVAGSGPNNGIFGINSNVTSTISGLTLTGSYAPVAAAINNAGNLTLTDMVITGNSANLGGGVFNNGFLTIIRSVISDNGGSLTNPVTNQGGGIFIYAGRVDVSDSIIANNFAANGGGIYSSNQFSPTTLTLTRSTVTGNIASFGVDTYSGEGGGIFNQGAATLVNTDVRGNLTGVCFRPNINCGNGGSGSSGIYRGGGSLTLINSTVYDSIGVPLTSAGSFSNQNSLLLDSGANFGGGSVPDGFVNTPYNATLVANTNGVTYSLLGGSLPPGITLATNGNVVSLSGMTDKTGRFDFSVKGTNGSSISVTYYSFRFFYPSPLPPNGCLSNPVVTSGSLAGAGTLQQAVSDACEGSTITFRYWVTGTIRASLTIDKNLTITGPGAGLLEVYGFGVNGGVTATISGFNITNRSIYNSGNLTLSDSTVIGVTVGGIVNYGNLTVTNSIIENNGFSTPIYQGAFQGGGIASYRGTLTITNSTVRNNHAASGCGVWNGSTMTMTNSTISGNRCNHPNEIPHGGGIYNLGTATITNSTISGNIVQNSSIVTIPSPKRYLKI